MRKQTLIPLLALLAAACDEPTRPESQVNGHASGLQVATAGDHDFLLTWGHGGSNNGEFSEPHGVAVDANSNVYIADTGNDRIQKFDSEGNFLSTWGSSGSMDGEFNGPAGIAVDGRGYVYVADTGNHRIQIFDSEGVYLNEWGGYGSGEGLFDHPVAVDELTTCAGCDAFGASGYVYVADLGNHRVQKFTSDGMLVATWGELGYYNGQFIEISGVAVDADGFAYVIDTGREDAECATCTFRNNHRVQKFDPDGTFVVSWGNHGSGAGEFDSPSGITVDADGNVYVADTYNDRIQKFASDGTFQDMWGSSGTGDGQFSDPHGIAVDAHGNVYVADTGNNRIQRFGPAFSAGTPSGSGVEVQPVDPSTGSSPVTITFGEVTEGGTTSLTTSGTGPPPPEGFKLGSPPVYFDVTTTATNSGVITVCLDYSDYAEQWFGGNENKERSLKLFHRETDPVTGAETWENVTTSHDPDANIICGEVSSLSLFVGALDGEGPVVSGVVADPNPVAVDAPVNLSAFIDDASTGGSIIASAEYTIDDAASWSPLTAVDGTFDAAGEDVSGSAAFPAPEVLDICIRGTDSADNTGNPGCILLAVYDPSGSFVTGGGWIDSPEKAYKPEPDLAGKASFGFVSKYQKGTQTPTGKTEFQFRAGGLNFQSTAYEWLVVTGSDYARFKGSGTINGMGDYRFMVWAGDGNPDTFRLRIWAEDESTGVETDRYDNGFDQAIGGGSIVVHTK